MSRRRTTVKRGILSTDGCGYRINACAPPRTRTHHFSLSNLSLSVRTPRDPGSFDWEYIYIGSFSTCLLWCVKLIFGMSTQSKKPESTHPVCVWFLFSAAHNAIFIFSPFSKRGIWFFYVPLRLEVLSIPTVSSFYSFFPFPFQKLSPVARCVSEVEKFFSSPKFLPRWISTGKMNIGGTKRRKERLLTRLLKAQELVLSLPFAVFP